MSMGICTGGLLIAVEGIDGAGKTTLAHALADRFRAAGYLVNYGKEPTAGTWGQILRASAANGRLSPAEELHYLVMDRQEHVASVIAPTLAEGGVVILDRYYPSTAAYQGAAGLDVDWLLQQNAFAPVPDVVLLLDVDPEEGLRRIYARGDTPNHFETPDALARAREIFLNMPLPTRAVIDAHADVQAVEREAWMRILKALSEKLARTEGLTVAAAEQLLKIGSHLPTTFAAA